MRHFMIILIFSAILPVTGVLGNPAAYNSCVSQMRAKGNSQSSAENYCGGVCNAAESEIMGCNCFYVDTSHGQVKQCG